MDIIRRRGEGGGGVQRFQEAMDDLFQRFMYDWPTSAGEFAPELDVTDADDKVIVKADVPGLAAEDIDVSVQGNTLTISGDRKSVV